MSALVAGSVSIQQLSYSQYWKQIAVIDAYTIQLHKIEVCSSLECIHRLENCVLPWCMRIISKQNAMKG